jgi:hypothetical protein
MNFSIHCFQYICVLDGIDPPPSEAEIRARLAGR